MPSEPLLLFDPRRTVQLQGFSGRAATTTLHDATETGFQISGIFQAAEDFANVQLFSAYDYFNHLRLKPLPVTDLSGLTLQYDMEILPVNGEEGNVRPDCVRYASVGWDKLTITTGAGDIYEVPLMHHAAVVSGNHTPGTFGFSLHDRDADTLDEELVGKPTPALTDKAYVYFMGTRWSCSSAEAITFCELETELAQDIGNPDAPSCEQAIWWQDDPWFWHNFFINNTTVAVGPQSGFSDASEIAQFFANWFNNDPNVNGLVTCSASGNVVTVTLKPGANGPIVVWSNSGSAPATLTRFVQGVYTARVASSAEIRVGDYVGLDIGGANDEVVKVLSVSSGSFTAHFNHRHLAGAVCRVLPRARHFGRVPDSFGNLTEVFEPEVRTTLTYGSVCGTQSLYPTQIQQAPGLAEQRTTTYSWHCGTGLLASQADVENGFTVTYLYDRLGRRTEANEGNLRASTTAYDDGSRKVTAKADLRAFRAGELQTVTHYDQLGRVRLVRRSDGAPLSDTSETDGIKVQTLRRVASGGNIEIVSNPYRTGAESTMGWTCSQQDRNGRVRWVGSFAGPVAPNSCLDAANRTGLAETRYQGDVTVSIDPANKQRDVARDALGRLVAVTEYTGGAPATYLTTYAYNALDNLMVVQQGSQSRSFVYSSLGRLISAYNPESGGVSYTYFDHGGLYTRTDARSVTTTHSYDGLHRLRTKSYTDGTPGVTNEYYLAGYAPQVGRLKSVTSSVGATVYTYDALGRVTASSQTVAGSPHSYGFLYTWLLNDGLATMRYPSGRTITYTQDDAGRVVQVQDGSKIYAQGIGYTAHGAITQIQLGNGLVEQWLYNSRLQPTSIRLGDVAGSDSAFGAALDYGATNNNGNLVSQRITGMGLDRTQTYQYDGVNRLIGSGELAVWSRNFAYDQQGNGWVSSASGLSTSSFTPVTSNWFNAQNRLTGMGATYDGAGNQTAIGGFTFTYDAENRLKTSTINSYTTTYFYDGEGRRVKKLLASGEQTLFIYDAMGQLAAEYTTGQFAHSGTRYLTVDHLGSIRAVTSQEKTVLARRDYLPFGEEIPPPLGGRTSVWAADAGLLQKFTGKERDAETGLDFFEARYLSSTQGRFTSTDPLISGPHKLNDPQNWNLYGYARNNPLRFTDPSGEIIEEDIDDEYRKRYERWKKDYLSTVAGRRQWERYANDPNLTLTIRFDKAKSQGAEAGNYQWNSAGDLTAATITLGPKLDSGYPSSVSYPITSSLQGANVSGTVLAVTKLAHEFGHVNRTGQENAAFYQLQNQLIPQYNALFFASGRDPNHPGLKALEQQMGGTPIDISIRREHWAEANTVPYLRDRFPGKSMPNQIKQAIENYQKTYPGRVP